MVAITKASTGNLLGTSSSWSPAQVPTTADTVTWLTTSLGGTLTGNFGAQSITFNGAVVGGTQTFVTHNTGTLTLTGGWVFAATNIAGWTANTGVIAVGANNQTWALAHATGNAAMYLTGAGALTGSGLVTLSNNSGNASDGFAYIVASGACAGFTGTFILDNYIGLAINANAFSACNFTVNGVGCHLYPGVANLTLGGAGKTLTINNDVTLSRSSRSFTIAPNVALGSVLRTLTVAGNTTMSGTVTGTAGVTVAGASEFTQLAFDGSSSGLSGPCVVSVGHFIVNASTLANRYQPTSIDVTNATARFRYGGATSDFTFGSSLSGDGTISLSGNFAGDGMRFPAAPAAGNIATFAGKVQAQGVAASGFQNTKIRISELPQGLSFAGLALNASPIAAASITYDGAGQTKNTTVTVDSENNTSTAALTSGTYSLLSSGSGPIVLSGTVQRTNSSGAVTPTASARMSLTLGGTNTGDNTLSGDISEVGTNGAILGITKVDAGRWVLSGANSSHTGIHSISAGTLSAQSAKALGSATSAGGVTISGTGKLELSGNITLDKSSTPFTIHQTSPIISVGNNTVRTAGVTLGGTTTFEVTTGNRLAISNTGAITDGASTFGITKTGDGELALAAFTNTYDGVVVVSAGTLAIGSQAALGNGNVTLTGTLKYTGTGETYSRSTFLSGAAPSLEAAGSGAITVTNLSQDSTTKTLTLKGANTGANTVTVALSDSSNPLSLAKSGAGKWVTTGALSYSGSTTVSDGTLRVQTANSNTTSGAVTIGATGAVELVTDTLASTGGGAVLGSSHVAVNGGIIKTRGGTTQKGQMRYGGNLTFGADSSLYIGAAA
jgi:fibronectin-binding autotransporter adhesin